jgi:hypothetical protein
MVAYLKKPFNHNPLIARKPLIRVTQRDRHIQAIAGNGRMAWQRDSGYNKRARVEGQFARWKQVIGDGLRFHTDEARATEVAIAAAVLNRMLDLGCPNSVRVA